MPEKNHANRIVTTIHMISNTLLPLKLGGQGGNLANVSVENKSWLWHFRHGHLNSSSLRWLTFQDMVYGLPKVKDHKDVFEGCALGKHARQNFPRREAWRASYPLQLVYFDICGPTMQTKNLCKNSYFLHLLMTFLECVGFIF